MGNACRCGRGIYLSQTKKKFTTETSGSSAHCIHKDRALCSDTSDTLSERALLTEYQSDALTEIIEKEHAILKENEAILVYDTEEVLCHDKLDYVHDIFKDLCSVTENDSKNDKQCKSLLSLKEENSETEGHKILDHLSSEEIETSNSYHRNILTDTTNQECFLQEWSCTEPHTLDTKNTVNSTTLTTMPSENDDDIKSLSDLCELKSFCSSMHASTNAKDVPWLKNELILPNAFDIQQHSNNICYTDFSNTDLIIYSSRSTGDSSLKYKDRKDSLIDSDTSSSSIGSSPQSLLNRKRRRGYDDAAKKVTKKRRPHKAVSNGAYVRQRRKLTKGKDLNLRFYTKSDITTYNTNIGYTNKNAFRDPMTTTAATIAGAAKDSFELKKKHSTYNTKKNCVSKTIILNHPSVHKAHVKATNTNKIEIDAPSCGITTSELNKNVLSNIPFGVNNNSLEAKVQTDAYSQVEKEEEEEEEEEDSFNKKTKFVFPPFEINLAKLVNNFIYVEPTEDEIVATAATDRLYSHGQSNSIPAAVRPATSRPSVSAIASDIKKVGVPNYAF